MSARPPFQAIRGDPDPRA
jgi:hypothetical protein